MKNFNWGTQADFVFTNSACFGEEMMVVIEEKAMSMKVGSWFVSTMKQMKTSQDGPNQVWQLK